MDQIYDNLFHKVTKPARYTGGEWNSMPKEWDAVAVKVALAFPDIYEVGMSNMAIPILYEIAECHARRACRKSVCPLE